MGAYCEYRSIEEPADCPAMKLFKREHLITERLGSNNYRYLLLDDTGRCNSEAVLSTTRRIKLLTKFLEATNAYN